MTPMPRAFDADHPANRLIISDETVLFNNNTGTWRKITSRSADSDEIFVTLTNQGLSPAARPARGGGPQSRPRLPPPALPSPLPAHRTEPAVHPLVRVHLTRGTCYRAALAMLRPLMLKYILSFSGRRSAWRPRRAVIGPAA